MRKLFCDICNKELDNNNWEDKGFVAINIRQSASNPLIGLPFTFKENEIVTFKINDVCYHCVRKISNSITDILVKLINS